MKKLLLITILCIANFIVFLVPVSFVHATAKMILEIPKSVATPSPAPVSIRYDLPYPGILPTHPLYFFKQLRDTLVEMLISDPVKKIEFYILQADKKLGMAMLLADKKNNTESKNMFVQSQHSRDHAVALLESQITTAPINVGEKVLLSIEKHLEILHSRNMETDQMMTLYNRVKTVVDTQAHKK
jgi:hypothetical protein